MDEYLNPCHWVISKNSFSLIPVSAVSGETLPSETVLAWVLQCSIRERCTQPSLAMQNLAENWNQRDGWSTLSDNLAWKRDRGGGGGGEEGGGEEGRKMYIHRLGPPRPRFLTSSWVKMVVSSMYSSMPAKSCCSSTTAGMPVVLPQPSYTATNRSKYQNCADASGPPM